MVRLEQPMLCRVRSVDSEGAILVPVTPGNADNALWLPGDEWDGDPDVWNAPSTMPVTGDLVDVVVLGEKTPDGKPIVSRRQFGRQHVDDSWWGRDCVMQVATISKALIRGFVGNVPVEVEKSKYWSFADALGSWQAGVDHSALAKGDYLGGVVIARHPATGELLLDPIEYLDGLATFAAGRQTVQDNQVADMLSELDGGPLAVEIPSAVAERISPCLLVEDDQDCRRSIQLFLERGGVTVQSLSSVVVASSEAATGQHDSCPGVQELDLAAFRLAIIDVNLNPRRTDLAGLAVAARLASVSKCTRILMTGEEDNKAKGADWASLPVHLFIEKPLTMAQLLGHIEEALHSEPRPLLEWVRATEEDATRDEGEQEGFTENGAADEPRESIQEEVQQLVNMADGGTVIAFKIHPRSLDVECLALGGSGLAWQPFRGKIAKSVIMDAAYRRKPLVQSPRGHESQHRWTLKMMDYESFCGLRIPVHGRLERYSLAAFHPRKRAFNEDFVQRATLAAERIARAIDGERGLAKDVSESLLASSGMALECLGHEVHTGLITLSGITDELIDRYGLLGEEQADSEDFTACIRQLQLQTDELVRKARTLRGFRVKRVRLDVQDSLIRAAEGTRRMIRDLGGRPSQINIRTPEAWPADSIETRGAPGSLVMVFFNLFQNAVQQIAMMRRVRKYGVVWYECESRTDRHGDPVAIITVQDTGPGIHHEDWERVFTPGFSTRSGGMGMGLHICKEVLKSVAVGPRHANISIRRSVIWGGTVFAVALPLFRVGEEE